MRFIHTADVHLFATPDADKPWGKDRTLEIEETFGRIISDCNEKDVDLLLIAGGLFDVSPVAEDLEVLDELLSQLEKTRTVILSGSSDYIAPDSDAAGYKFKTRTVMLPAGRTTNAYLKGINTCVTGFSYAKPEYTERIIEEIRPGREDAINILIGHGGDRRHMPYRKDVILRRGFDYVAMGYIRKPTHILKNRMAYAGSPEPLSHEETGRHGYILGEITSEGTSIEWCPIAKRSYIDINVTLDSSVEVSEIAQSVENRIMKLGIDNIYTIIIKGFADSRLQLNFDRVKERYNIYKIVDMTITEDDERMLREENETNLMGSFIREVSDSYTLSENIRNSAKRYGMEALIVAGEK